MNDAPPRPDPPPLNTKTLLQVALWGASTALIAYALAFGSYIRFVINIVVIAILVRVVARLVWLRLGKKPPRWWWK
jgi:hypothetical protein